MVGMASGKLFAVVGGTQRKPVKSSGPGRNLVKSVGDIVASNLNDSVGGGYRFDGFMTVDDYIMSYSKDKVVYDEILLYDMAVLDTGNIQGDLVKLKNFIENYSSSTTVVLILAKHDVPDVASVFNSVFTVGKYAVADLRVAGGNKIEYGRLRDLVKRNIDEIRGKFPAVNVRDGVQEVSDEGVSVVMTPSQQSQPSAGTPNLGVSDEDMGNVTGWMSATENGVPADDVPQMEQDMPVVPQQTGPQAGPGAGIPSAPVASNAIPQMQGVPVQQEGYFPQQDMPDVPDVPDAGAYGAPQSNQGYYAQTDVPDVPQEQGQGYYAQDDILAVNDGYSAQSGDVNSKYYIHGEQPNPERAQISLDMFPATLVYPNSRVVVVFSPTSTVASAIVAQKYACYLTNIGYNPFIIDLQSDHAIMGMLADENVNIDANSGMWKIGAQASPFTKYSMAYMSDGGSVDANRLGAPVNEDSFRRAGEAIASRWFETVNGQPLNFIFILVVGIDVMMNFEKMNLYSNGQESWGVFSHIAQAAVYNGQEDPAAYPVFVLASEVSDAALARSFKVLTGTNYVGENVAATYADTGITAWAAVNEGEDYHRFENQPLPAFVYDRVAWYK